MSSPIVSCWTTLLPDSVNVRQDPTQEVLNLLRTVPTLNRLWGFLYQLVDYKLILPSTELMNSKLTAKANRQLQDQLAIMTGNLLPWLAQIVTVWPFLFIFETLQLFHAAAFDRGRAIQRLMIPSPELMSGRGNSESVAPRLDRRKRSVCRDKIPKQAEQVVQSLASSRALFEVQYENEFETGLGPTQEFYARVSRELQQFDVVLWRGGAVSTGANYPEVVELSSNVKSGVAGPVEYIYNKYGLFPLPCSRSLKVGPLAKIFSNFRFLGKFIVKSIMDSRMVQSS